MQTAASEGLSLLHFNDRLIPVVFLCSKLGNKIAGQSECQKIQIIFSKVKATFTFEFYNANYERS